ncbi:hypothetical protein [Acutalibacter sp. 1XD8-36]|uniref:hypothetical protein n=1 Tax=Acutalibacter sp. 1XD8-36 TaxID=2320852 RepID=UPI00141271FF|nr:hypothetical protein [Acutalibacter sp. 1XD8-36]NBJ90877.1 hypothetical protein [Acutalibacter sp. 1XD8-36]
MKKFIALLIAVVLCVISPLSAFAATTDKPSVDTVDKETEYYAYLDIEKAKADVKAQLLLSRNATILGSNWVADGFEGYIGDARTGEVLQVLPKFSELYPNWDIPNYIDVKSAQERISGNETQIDISEYIGMDVTEAQKSIENKILEARREIIYSNNWIADGYEGYIGDRRTGTREKLPTFSTLFPDWDIPVEKVTLAPSVKASATPLSSKKVIFQGTAYMGSPTATGDPTFFRTTTGGAWEIRSYATRIPGQNYNLGYTNMSTGRSIASATKLAVYQFLSIHGSRTSSTTVGVRTSTYSTTGIGYFTVERFPFE